MNIVLVGYRGTGKSTVAELLAERLQWPVLHLDQEIVDRSGLSIPEIVARYGWDHFRDLESHLVIEAAARDSFVIDTGGGVILKETNIKALRRNGMLFWLKASPATIAARIKSDTERPSLTGTKSFLEEIEDVLNDRTPRYREAADYEIDTDELSSQETADAILAMLDG